MVSSLTIPSSAMRYSDQSLLSIVLVRKKQAMLYWCRTVKERKPGMSRTKTPTKKLTPDEFRKAARLYIASAQAHQRASVLCRNNTDPPYARPPTIDAWFFLAVSFEMILLSVEQSLRLALLLHYSIVREATNHDPLTRMPSTTRYEGTTIV